MSSVTGIALYHFSEGRPFVPYGVFGIGFGHADADVPDSREAALVDVATSSNNLIVNFGGGVERALSNRVGLEETCGISSEAISFLIIGGLQAE